MSITKLLNSATSRKGTGQEPSAPARSLLIIVDISEAMQSNL